MPSRVRDPDKFIILRAAAPNSQYRYCTKICEIPKSAKSMIQTIGRQKKAVTRFHLTAPKTRKGRKFSAPTLIWRYSSAHESKNPQNPSIRLTHDAEKKGKKKSDSKNKPDFLRINELLLNELQVCKIQKSLHRRHPAIACDTYQQANS